MNNDYIIIIEYKNKLTSSVSYQKRFHYENKTIGHIMREEVELSTAFARIGYFLVSSFIVVNNSRMILSKDYSYEGR